MIVRVFFRVVVGRTARWIDGTPCVRRHWLAPFKRIL
jgi:hypothetical protein